MPGENVAYVDVDVGDTAISIPFFHGYMRKRLHTTECCICGTDLREIDYGPLYFWTQSCQGFPGN